MCRRLSWNCVTALSAAWLTSLSVSHWYFDPFYGFNNIHRMHSAQRTRRPRRSAPLCFADRAEQFPQLPLLFLCFKWTQSTRCTHPTHATTSEMWWETQQQSILGHHGELPFIANNLLNDYRNHLQRQYYIMVNNLTHKRLRLCLQQLCQAVLVHQWRLMWAKC